jgi:aromatic ring-opening dioxygenase LigB subunit
MPLVFAAIMPHGGEIIPELAEDPSVMAQTRCGMMSIGSSFIAADINTVIVITPHGHVYQDVITVSCCKTAAGALDGPRGERIGASFTVDTDLANALLNHPTLPLVGLTTGDDTTDFPLDWGALIPLLFTADTDASACKVVVLAEDRGLSRDVLVAAGKHIAHVAEASPKRIALIASCDLGHAHAADGPYGYHHASKVHDDLFTQLVSENRLDVLLDWDEAFLEDAKVDAYWQTLMLYGALTVVPMSVTFYTYEAPTYFGMLTASYLRL